MKSFHCRTHRIIDLNMNIHCANKFLKFKYNRSGDILTAKYLPTTALQINGLTIYAQLAADVTL